MTNLEKLNEDYENDIEALENLEAKLEQQKEILGEDLDYLAGIYEAIKLKQKYYNFSSHSYILEQQFLEKYPDFSNYLFTLRCIEDLKKVEQEALDFEGTISSYDQFLTLKSECVNFYNMLKSNDIPIDLSDINREKVNIIIEKLKIINPFLRHITIDDLPLLINILDEEHYTARLQEGNVSEEEYHTLIESLNTYIEEELFKAYGFDTEGAMGEKNKELALEEELKRLDNAINDMPLEENFKKRYKLLILRDKKVEDLYLNAPKHLKPLVIEAYQELSSSEKTHQHIRTASPLINLKVLKNKISEGHKNKEESYQFYLKSVEKYRQENGIAPEFSTVKTYLKSAVQK